MNLRSLMLLILLIALGFGGYRQVQRWRSVAYVQGDVKSPGKRSLFRASTVFEALELAGGPISPSLAPEIRVIRPATSRLVADRILPVDLEAIVKRGDQSTNYRLEPNDRLVVYRVSHQIPAR